MKPKIVIIDYQLGNLFSVKQACTYLDQDVEITNDADRVRKADMAILPGVGAFRDAMTNLESNSLDLSLKEFVISGKPLMGICLGMQLLFSSSREFGNSEGLKLIPGEVLKFKSDNIYKVPQIQWNTIHGDPTSWSASPLKSCDLSDYMYFVHSFYVKPDHEIDVLSTTSYAGIKYCSSILHGNVFATQFHPEKSGIHGVKIYKNWIDLNK